MAIIQFQATGGAPDTKGEEEAKAKFRSRLEKMQTDLSGALGNPKKLATDMQELLGDKEGVSKLGGLKNGLKMLRRVISSGRKIASTVGTTVGKIQQFKNAEALKTLVIDSAIVEMAGVAKETKFASSDDAIEVRTEVAGLLQDAAESATNDNTFLAYMDLKASVVKDITSRAADLSKVETKQPPSFTNTLTMAYSLYGDANRQEEIAERNGLAMPGFIAPKPLKVLNV